MRQFEQLLIVFASYEIASAVNYINNFECLLCFRTGMQRRRNFTEFFDGYYLWDQKDEIHRTESMALSPRLGGIDAGRVWLS